MAHPALVASASITRPTDPALVPQIGVPSFRGRTGLGQNKHLFFDRNSEARVACACGPFCVCLFGSGFWLWQTERYRGPQTPCTPRSACVPRISLYGSLALVRQIELRLLTRAHASIFMITKKVLQDILLGVGERNVVPCYRLL